jgi:HEAT repeat protein
MSAVSLALLATAPSVSADPAEDHLRTLALAADAEALRSEGLAVLPRLARLYEATASPRERAQIARVFYRLGWPSEDAKRVLMADVHTPDRELRLEVQWALGRVSSDPEVVDVLLDNMRHDVSPLFRDKAACALAHDQIHLAPEQKVRLLAGLIAALDDPTPQVRQISLQALQILTGQTKGYQPHASADVRRGAIEAWRRWLAEYRSQL